MICAPVREKNRVVGFFGVDCLHQRKWREDQADLLILVANLLSEALERDRLEQELISQSITDPLTGLKNRRYLMPRLEGMIEALRREGRPFSLALLDLDRFKQLNDAHGHLVGDAVLTEFAALVGESVRAVDLVVRFGGEEFLVVFSDADLAEALPVVERILNATRSHLFSGPSGRLSVSVSGGLACVAELAAEDVSVERLIGLADERLYRAKNTGRDRVVSE